MLHQGYLFVVLLTSTRFLVFASTSSALMAEGITLGSPQGEIPAPLSPSGKAFFDMLYKIISPAGSNDRIRRSRCS